MEAVTKSTHGYFKSVPVVSDLFSLPAIAILYTERRSMTATVSSALVGLLAVMMPV
jgi:hypothetical protein